MKILSIIFGLSLTLAAALAYGQGAPDLFQPGQEIYNDTCAACHRTNGEGLPAKFPALKGNAFVQGDSGPVIKLILGGRKGNLGQMPAWQDRLDDTQTAAVATYIRGAWTNQALPVTPAMVKSLRDK